jgi:DNA-binding protein
VSKTRFNVSKEKLQTKEVYYMSKNPNIIYIGRKPVMSYVLAVITSFNSSDTKEVTLKARGRSMTTSVDVAEVVKRRFMKDLKASKITIGTEELEQEEGGTRNVSTMEIMLTRD